MLLFTGALVDDERLKMVLPQACCYCGSSLRLSVDHLIPSMRGGADTGDNIVWACRACNSSKGDRDMLEWFQTKGAFPPLLLLRRYLKLAITITRAHDLMNATLNEATDLPFTASAVPTTFPSPNALRLWSTALA